jgi:hypothetical protein
MDLEGGLECKDMFRDLYLSAVNSRDRRPWSSGDLDRVWMMNATVSGGKCDFFTMIGFHL